MIMMNKIMKIDIPVYVGQRVYRIDNVLYYDDDNKTYFYNKEVVEYEVRSISINCNSKNKWSNKFRICEVKDNKIIDNQDNISFEEFGKSVVSDKNILEEIMYDERY